MTQYRKYSRVRGLEGQKKINLHGSICKKCLWNLSHGGTQYSYGPFVLCREYFFKQKDQDLEKFKANEQKKQ